MQKAYRVLAVALLNLLLLLAPVLETDNGLRATSLKATPYRFNTAGSSIKFEAEVSTIYHQTNLEQSGLKRSIFEYAYKGYLVLLEQHKLSKSDVITICDFSQSSRHRRLYVVDLENKKILVNTFVAHGRRSGGEYAKTFSNSASSHKSSLGFYITEQTYFGKHGLALKIHGLEKGFNDKADRRNIVVHGSKYIGEEFLKSNRISGRSFGCPAVPMSDVSDLIEDIRGGSCLFIYYPAKKYLQSSKILNG
ncbi:MAG: murein L,D-transpeptidase catalytic domain family protein [Bacteroidota bacterium]|nr:murein L,D-transpeptidase catalytic domain family protein [Bacteroidota bacterium]